MSHIIRFFDKFEDQVRGSLSHHPIIYALIGAVGVILVWKGVWDIADAVPGLWGPVSLALGVLLLLATGLLVSFFVGDTIILSGLKHEKKVVEKTETEIKGEQIEMREVLAELKEIEKDVEDLKRKEGI